MLERCRVFLIIALGETVLTMGAAALAGAVALWALGFERAGRLAVRRSDFAAAA